MKLKHFIDSHKGATGLAILAMIAWYRQWDNPTAWVYLGLHGGYGVLWVLKSRIFPDRQWDQRCSPVDGLKVWVALTGYWLAPWYLTSRGVHAPAWQLGACTALYAIGVFFHFASDMQKDTALRLRPGLLTDGMFALSRNPNYFGELCLYLGFGLLARHPLPIAFLLLFVAGYWLPGMLRKDRSLSRYPEFAAYRRRTRLFIPYLV